MKSAVQAINEIFSNSNERGKQSADDSSSRKINENHDMIKSLVDMYKSHSGTAGQQITQGEGS